METTITYISLDYYDSHIIIPMIHNLDLEVIQGLAELLEYELSLLPKRFTKNYTPVSYHVFNHELSHINHQDRITHIITFNLLPEGISVTKEFAEKRLIEVFWDPENSLEAPKVTYTYNTITVVIPATS